MELHRIVLAVAAALLLLSVSKMAGCIVHPNAPLGGAPGVTARIE